MEPLGTEFHPYWTNSEENKGKVGIKVDHACQNTDFYETPNWSAALRHDPKCRISPISFYRYEREEREQLEDRRNVGENSCNSGDGTDQIGPILEVYEDDDDDDDDDYERYERYVHKFIDVIK